MVFAKYNKIWELSFLNSPKFNHHQYSKLVYSPMFSSPKSRIHRFAKVLPCQNFVLYGNPFVGEDLLCEQEVGNPYDTHTVVVKKAIDGNLTVVGHVPQTISSICSIFLRRGGTINCSVDGSRRYSSDILLKEDLKYRVLTFPAQSSVEGSKQKTD